jgi:transposase InsO family protein
MIRPSAPLQVAMVAYSCVGAFRPTSRLQFARIAEWQGPVVRVHLISSSRAHLGDHAGHCIRHNRQQAIDYLFIEPARGTSQDRRDDACRRAPGLHLDRATTRVRSPQTNGVVERFFGSLKHEHLYRADIGDGDDLAVEVHRFTHLYNTIRPHQALAECTRKSSKEIREAVSDRG